MNSIHNHSEGVPFRQRIPAVNGWLVTTSLIRHRLRKTKSSINVSVRVWRTKIDFTKLSLIFFLRPISDPTNTAKGSFTNIIHYSNICYNWISHILKLNHRKHSDHPTLFKDIREGGFPQLTKTILWKSEIQPIEGIHRISITCLQSLWLSKKATS